MASGLYTSASEGMRETLYLMDEQDRLREEKLEQLHSDGCQGLVSGSSETCDAAAVKSKARSVKHRTVHNPRSGDRLRGEIAPLDLAEAGRW